MDFLLLITVVNWIVIVGLGILIGLETITPNADAAAGRGMGMGEAIYWLAIIAWVTLLILNLLPHPLGRHVAFGLIVVPMVWFTVISSLRKFISRLVAELMPRKPLFPDRERDQLSRAVGFGKVEDFKKWPAKTPLERLNEGGEMLCFAVNEVPRTGTTRKKGWDVCSCCRRLAPEWTSQTPWKRQF